jgi:hypothetical protein
MSRYDRSYDFGMRGYPQTTRPLGRRPPGRIRYDRYFEAPFAAMDGGDVPLSNRVTARYNRDYVDGYRGYDRGYGFPGGDRVDRTVDESYYRRPYNTIGGSRTMRGARGAQRSAPGQYGPSYGGRFPDEL